MSGVTAAWPSGSPSSVRARWASASRRCSPRAGSRPCSSIRPRRGPRRRAERSLELLSRLEETGNVDRGAARTAEQHLSAAVTVDDRRSRRRSGRRRRRRARRRQDRRLRGDRGGGERRGGHRDEHVVDPDRAAAAGLRRPHRFLGVHWFVPPLLVPCVEVIPTAATDEDVVEQVLDALTRLGKTPSSSATARLRASRIQFALFREAARIVEDGIAAPEQVDEVVRSSFGFRLPFFGPFTIADMAGLDVYADIFDTLERGLGEASPLPGSAGARRPRGLRRQDWTRVPRPFHRPRPTS